MAEVRNLVREIVRRDLIQCPIEVAYTDYHDLLYYTQQIWNRIFNSVGREKTRLNLVYARHLLELLERFPDESTNDIEVKCLTALGNFCTSMAEAPSEITSLERIDYALSALSCFRSRNALMPLNATSLTLVRVALQVYLSALVDLRAPQAEYDFSEVAHEMDEALDPYQTLILQTASNRNAIRNNLLFDFFRARVRPLVNQGKRVEFEKAFTAARAYIDPTLLSPERRAAWQNFKVESEAGQSREQLAEAREVELRANPLAVESDAAPTTASAAASPTTAATEPELVPDGDEELTNSFEEELATHLGPIRSPRIWLEQKMTPNDPQRGTSMPQVLFQLVQGGIDAYKMGDYEAALRQFNQADLQNPSATFRHVLFYNRAATLLAMNEAGKSQQAEQLLEQATSLGSRLPGLRWNLAVAYWRNHGVDKRLIDTLNEVVDAGRKAPLCSAAACYLLGNALGSMEALLRAKALPGSVPDLDEELQKLAADYPNLAPQLSAELARLRANYPPQPARPAEQPYQPEQPYQRTPYGQPPYTFPNQTQQPYGQPPQPQQPAYGQPQPSQPPYGQPQPTQPTYGQPQSPQPPYAQPQPTQPPYGQAQQPYQQPYPRPYNAQAGYSSNPNQPYPRPYNAQAGYSSNPNQQPYPRPYNAQAGYSSNPNQQPYPRPYNAPAGYHPPRPQGEYQQPPAANGEQRASFAPPSRLGGIVEQYGKLLDLLVPFADGTSEEEELQRSQLEFSLGLARLEQQTAALEGATQQAVAPLFDKWRRLGEVLAGRVQSGLSQSLILVKAVQRQISDAAKPSGLVIALTNQDVVASVSNIELRLPPRPDTYTLASEVGADGEGAILRVPMLGPGATRYLKFNLAPLRPGPLDLVFELAYQVSGGDDQQPSHHRSHVLLQPALQAARIDPVSSFYLAGESIPEDRDDIFKGRGEEIARVKASLGLGTGGSRHQSMIPYLTGISKVGKSSLLNNLTNPRLHPDLHQSFLPVRISMDEYQGDEYKLPFFLKALAARIGKAMTAAGYSAPAIEPLWPMLREAPLITFFDDYLGAVSDTLRPRRLLLMFDEFRYLADKIRMGDWDSGFLSKLRTLYQNGLVGLIFAGRGNFSEVTRGLNEPSLLDSVRDQPLSFLNPGAVRELIEQPSGARGITFVPEAGGLISQLTGGHPFFVQSLCHDVISEVLNRERRKVVIPEDVKQINKLYLQSDNLFSHIWNGEMREVHQEVIFTLLQLQEGSNNFVDRGALVAGISHYPPRDVATAVEFLRQREVLEESSSSEHFVRIRIPLLYGWFQNKHTRGLSLAPSRVERLQDVQTLTEQVIRLRRKCNQWRANVFKEDASDSSVAEEMMHLAAESWADFERLVQLIYKYIGNEAIINRDYLREVPRFGELVRDLQAIRNGVAHRLDNDRYPDSADAAYKAIDKYLGHQPVAASDFLELQELVLRSAISGLNELREAVER